MADEEHHDHAGQDVSADLAALLDHDHFNVFASFLCQLFRADRRGQTRRTAADDANVRDVFVSEKKVPRITEMELMLMDC